MSRVSSFAFPTYCCAVIHRNGHPDEFLVDDAGKPRRFASATEAIRAGKEHVGGTGDAPCPADPGDDPLGIQAWRLQKERDLAEERDRVFGPDEPSFLERRGRTVVVERRRRR